MGSGLRGPDIRPGLANGKSVVPFLFLFGLWIGNFCVLDLGQILIHKILLFPGDDCVSSEYVEDDRVGKIYGQSLINSVRETIHKSACHVNINNV